MPKKSDYDAERLRHVLQAQHQVITRIQALACGIPQSTLDRYIAPGAGPAPAPDHGGAAGRIGQVTNI
jgi:hypothetical protein